MSAPWWIYAVLVVAWACVAFNVVAAILCGVKFKNPEMAIVCGMCVVVALGGALPISLAVMS